MDEKPRLSRLAEVLFPYRTVKKGPVQTGSLALPMLMSLTIVRRVAILFDRAVAKQCTCARHPFG
jgi:hypothetical protein